MALVHRRNDDDDDDRGDDDAGGQHSGNFCTISQWRCGVSFLHPIHLFSLLSFSVKFSWPPLIMVTMTIMMMQGKTRLTLMITGKQRHMGRLLCEPLSVCVCVCMSFFFVYCMIDLVCLYFLASETKWRTD